jgi:hypothetical protein
MAAFFVISVDIRIIIVSSTLSCEGGGLISPSKKAKAVERIRRLEGRPELARDSTPGELEENLGRLFGQYVPLPSQQTKAS